MKAHTVLIVDDEEELVLTLIERLGLRGIRAEGSYNGHAALERIEKGGIDVAIIDLKMPGLSGVDLNEAIANRFPDVTVILITGHGVELEDQSTDDLELKEVLLKPFKLPELITTIERVRAERGSAK